MQILSLTSITNDKGDKKMKYFKYTISLDQGTQMHDGKWDVTSNETEVKLEDLTDYQDEALAELFATLMKENKSKIDKTVEAIR